jgi:acyl carrier protein
LPAPEGNAYAVQGYQEPEGETERALAGIWAELLHVERVGRQDNFFELGGHSLLAVRVLARVRHVLGAEISISDLFAYPILSDLALKIVDVQFKQFDRLDMYHLLKLVRGK